MVHTRRRRSDRHGQMFFALGATFATGAATALIGGECAYLPALCAGLIVGAVVGVLLRRSPGGRDGLPWGGLRHARLPRSRINTAPSDNPALTCLAGVDESCNASPADIETVLAELVERLPEWWPDGTVDHVEIDVGDRVFATGGTLRGCARAELELSAGQRVLGSIRLAGSEAGPLSADATRLLSLVAGRIGCYLRGARLAEAVARASERLDLALDGGNVGLWEYDVLTATTTCCDRCSAILGCAGGHIDRDSWAERIHDEDALDTLATFNAHLTGQTNSYESEYRVRTAGGEWKWVRTRGRIVERDDAGRPVRLAGTCSDISHRRRFEQAVQAARCAYETLRDAAADAFLLHSPDGRLLDANTSASALLGYPRDQLLRMSLEDIVSLDAVEYLPDLRARLQRRGELLFETVLCTASGTPVPVEVKATQVHHVDGPAIMCFVHDITERKAAEFRAHAACRLWEGLAECHELIICELTPDSRVRSWSRGAELATGYIRADVVGQSAIWRRVCPTADVRRRLSNLLRESAPEGAWSPGCVIEVRRRDGGRVQVRCACRALADERGRVSGFLVVGIQLDGAPREVAQLGLAGELTDVAE